MQSEVRQPLEGLPVLDGLKCVKCPPDVRPHLTTSAIGFAKHVRKAHGKHGSQAMLIDTCSLRVCVQALGAVNPRRVLFEVRTCRLFRPQALVQSCAHASPLSHCPSPTAHLLRSLAQWCRR